MRTKMLVSLCAAVAFVAVPVLGAHASIQPRFNESAVYEGITFSNPSAPCGGPVIGAYGANALRNYITAAATAYCTFETSPGGPFAGNAAAAPMVVYASGGDACPGVVFAGSDNTDPVLGLSGVYPASCVVEGFALGPNAISDNNQAIVVPYDLIAPCKGANEPQGGAIPAYSPGGPTPCTGGGIDEAVNPLGFCAPTNLSQQQAQAVLAGTVVGNWSKVGGCNQPSVNDNRIAGSGTRVSVCMNIFGPGVDNCNNGGAGATGPFATTGAMENGICGPYGASPGADGDYSLGYADRSNIVISGQSGAPANRVLSGCGLVAVNGTTGWNGACDQQNPGGSPAGTHSADPIVAGNPQACNGDLQVATGQHQLWGYGHLDVATAVNGTNQPAKDFVNWVAANEPASVIQSTGQMRFCQMGFKRGQDGGALSVRTATCAN